MKSFGRGPGKTFLPRKGFPGASSPTALPYHTEYDAVVVGSGPNGLAAAITIAQAGRSVLVIEARDSIGGGARTQELILPGVLHDVCSAIHPLGLASPFFRSLDLEPHGLTWIHPPAPLAHPLREGRAASLYRSLDRTAEGLGRDANSYRKLVGPMTEQWRDIVQDLLKPLGPPGHPLALLPFALRGMRSAAGLARSTFKDEPARALFAGNAGHSILPLEQGSTAAFGLMLCMLGHAVGWPIAERGSQSIVDAMGSYLVSLGGKIQVSRPVKSLGDIPSARALLFDLTPRQVAEIAGDRFPSGYRRRLETHRYGPGVFKIDWALSDPIPWRARECLEAGTVHVGGTLEEIAAAEAEVWRGNPPQKPFTLVSQPSLFDATRAPQGMHTAWGYCHVPSGCRVDMTDRIERGIEEFAPGFRDVILERHVMSPASMEEYNPNYIGGDIVGGVQSFAQLFVRPLGRWGAYSTPAKGLYICSSSMPPGAGVHGMCGHLAAKKALAEVL